MGERAGGKKVWILNHYAGAPENTAWLRHYYFAQKLAARGYAPTVMAASSRHNGGENLIQDGQPVLKAQSGGVPFLYIWARDYGGNGMSRVMNMVDFARGLMKVTRDLPAPDCIIASSVHPLTCVAGLRLAKKRKVPCVVEIRDLWPESIVAYKGLSPRHPVTLVLRRLEKWIYKRADRIIFTMEGGGDYIRERGWEKAVNLDKVVHINNGVDLADYDARLREAAPVKASGEDVFRLVYTGSIRLVNGLETIVEAAGILSKKGYNKIVFDLYGGGGDRDALEAICREKGLRNVRFPGMVPKRDIPLVLAGADALLLHVQQTPISRFGMSMNKLFEYMASGKPILSDLQTAYDPIERYGCGLITASGSAQDIAEGAISLYEMAPEERERLGRNARIGAEEYDFEKLAEKLIHTIEGSL